MYSQILCYVSAKFLQHPECNEAWKNRVAGSKPGKATEIMMLSTESRLNSSGTFSQGSQRCSSVIKISDLLSSMGQTPESFTGRILFMSMFNDIFCDRYDNKDECLRNANIVKTFAGRFGVWSMVIYWTRF